MVDKEDIRAVEEALKELRKKQNRIQWKKHLTFKKPLNFSVMKVLNPEFGDVPIWKLKG